MKSKAIFCWSGGKDSAYCLHKVLQEQNYEVCYLLTTINETHKRISMHGVKEELLDKQAQEIGISLIKVVVSEGTNAEYEKKMETVLLNAKTEGIKHVIYGDIFLDDLKAYREKNLEKVQMQCVFPLWKTDTKWLVNDFVDKGFKTIVCCVSDGFLGENWVGRVIDKSFINELPKEVDPCGENGEFHTFCFEGPLFKNKIQFRKGKKVYKPIETNIDHEFNTPENNTKGLWYCDLIP